MSNVKRYPSKTNVLQFLRDAGVPVGTVLDVGAHEQTIELRHAFPDKPHLLFEPLAELHPALRENYAGMDYIIVSAALSDADGSGLLRKIDIEGGGAPRSTLVDAPEAGQVEQVATMRLDTFMRDRSDPKPYLLKLDVDGHEMPIMRGAEKIWPDIGIVIVEVLPETIAERMNYVLSKGFRLFDIVDQCYYYGMFAQVDLVFIADRLMDNPALRPWWSKPLRWDEWRSVAGYESVIQANAADKS